MSADRAGRPNSDIGKWCFRVHGSLVGFCETREEAERLFGYTLSAPRNDYTLTEDYFEEYDY
jgi:hypothetical protein